MSVFFKLLDDINFFLHKNLKEEKIIFTLEFVLFFFGEGPRSRCYGRTAALMLIVQPLWLRVFFIYPCNGAPVELNWKGKTEVFGGGGGNLSQGHFVNHKSHMDTWHRTLVSAVRGRRLTAWAMTRPIWYISVGFFRTLFKESWMLNETDCVIRQ
jgi:hypothetical protein